MNTRTATRVALAIGMTSLALLALGLSLLVVFQRLFPGLEAYPYWWGVTIGAPIYAAVGTLVATRRPNHSIGWLFAVCGLASSIQLVTGQYAVTSLAAVPGALPGGAIAAWVSQQLQTTFVGMLIFLLLLFPTGRLPSRQWWFVAWFIVAGLVLMLVDLGFSPGGFEDFPIENPFGVAGTVEVLDIVGGIGVALFLLGLFGAIISLLIRFRRARGLERQQIKWFVYAAVLAVAVLVGGSALFAEQMSGPVGNIMWAAATTSLSVAAAVAILRYRLWDIDVIIRRTLQYSVLSGLLALIYFGSVVLVQSLFRALTGQNQNQLVTVVSTLALAGLFAPLRRRVQDVIDRRFYRKKYDAAKTLAEFAATCRDETDLDKLTARLVQVVQETMQPESVSLWLRKDPQDVSRNPSGLSRERTQREQV